MGFFGEINRLSNFYPSTYLYDGIQYISSEQLIQANKTKFFGDLDTYNQILSCSTSLECKNLSRQIRNVDKSEWEEEAGNICHPGICAKFFQNPFAMDTLLHRTGSKRIVECASNRLWGTGLSLGEPSCLDSSKWFSQGILGQILESIRNEASQIRGQSYLVLPPTIHNFFCLIQSGIPSHSSKNSVHLTFCSICVESFQQCTTEHGEPMYRLTNQLIRS